MWEDRQIEAITQPLKNENKELKKWAENSDDSFNAERIGHKIKKKYIK